MPAQGTLAGLAGALILAASIGLGPALAQPVTVDGITFSDERGDFTIVKVTGSGRLDDPFVVVEDVTGSEPILVIRGLDTAFGNRIGSQHVVGFAITKIAINHTGAAWSEYRLELRTAPNEPSPYGDGLSFAQGWNKPRNVESHGFHHAEVIDEPYDAIDFTDGRVKDGDAASFDFYITDMMPRPEVFLLQEPVRSVACAIRPGAAMAC
jgi:hypothetical protein